MPIEDVRAIFSDRVHQYERAVVTIAALREGREAPRLLRGAVRFARGSVAGEERMDYGPLVLERRILRPDEAMKFIESVVSSRSADGFDLRVPGDTQFAWDKLYGWRPGLPLPIGAERFSEWPAETVLWRAQSNITGDPQGPLVRPDLPVIIEPNEKIDQWNGFSTTRAGNMQNGLMIVLPDFRVRITRVRFETKAVRVHLEMDSSLFKADRLRTKAAVYLSGGSSAETSVGEVEDGWYRVEVPQIPQVFHFFALDGDTGNVIDWARVYTSWPAFPPEVEFATPGQQIRNLIEGGETDQVEFKIERGDGFALLQSVVAFANSDNGGVIIVGVDDNAKIVGTAKPQADIAKIQEWIENKCDPPIGVKFEPVQIDDKDLTIVRIPPGTNRPYQHRDNGVPYVRRNATDRPARRAELDELFRKRSSGS